MKPGAMGQAHSYIRPLRRMIAARPTRSSFLMMWLPLPTSTLPLLLGLFVPRSELRLGAFVCGAFPSKLLHFACDVLVGLEAGSLAAALDAHDDLPGLDDLDPDQAASKLRARRVAIGSMGLTVLFMAAMAHTMHAALREVKAKEEAEASALPDV